MSGCGVCTVESSPYLPISPDWHRACVILHVYGPENCSAGVSRVQIKPFQVHLLLVMFSSLLNVSICSDAPQIKGLFFKLLKGVLCGLTIVLLEMVLCSNICLVSLNGVISGLSSDWSL